MGSAQRAAPSPLDPIRPRPFEVPHRGRDLNKKGKKKKRKSTSQKVKTRGNSNNNSIMKHIKGEFSSIYIRSRMHNYAYEKDIIRRRAFSSMSLPSL